MIYIFREDKLAHRLETSVKDVCVHKLDVAYGICLINVHCDARKTFYSILIEKKNLFAQIYIRWKSKLKNK